MVYMLGICISLICTFTIQLVYIMYIHEQIYTCVYIHPTFIYTLSKITILIIILNYAHALVYYCYIRYIIHLLHNTVQLMYIQICTYIHTHRPYL